MSLRIGKYFFILFLLFIPVCVFAQYKLIKVQKGETLQSIARKYLNDESRVKDIAKLNDIPSPYVISVGQILKLPLAREEEENIAKKIEEALINIKVELGTENTEQVYRFAVRRLEWIKKQGSDQRENLKNLHEILKNINSLFKASEIYTNIKIIASGNLDGEKVDPVSLTAKPLINDVEIFSNYYVNGNNGLGLNLSNIEIINFKDKGTISIGPFLKSKNGEYTGICEIVNGEVLIRTTDILTGWYVFVQGQLIVLNRAIVSLKTSKEKVSLSVMNGFVALNETLKLSGGERIDIHSSGEILRYPKTPVFVRPVDNFATREEEILFQWLDAGSVSYKFQLKDCETDEVLIEKILTSNYLRVIDALEGEYLYRVASINNDIEGDYTEWRKIKIDYTQPSLELISPTPTMDLPDENVEFSGKTEAYSIVRINGVLVSADENGCFSGNIIFSKGMNLVRIDITDKALNKSHFRGEFVYSENRAYVFEGDTKIETRNAIIPVTGWADIDEEISVQNIPVVVDKDGFFVSKVFLDPGKNLLNIGFKSGNKTMKKEYDIIRDDKPPLITYSSLKFLPGKSKTQNDSVVIEIRASDGDGIGLEEKGEWRIAGVGDLQLDGLLLLKNNVYTTVIQIPKQESINILLGEVIIKDKIGNAIRKEMQIDIRP
ncbi:MAG: LysM domain-containing protein [Candidatus Hydrogenedentota bacterium]